MCPALLKTSSKSFWRKIKSVGCVGVFAVRVAAVSVYNFACYKKQKWR